MLRKLAVVTVVVFLEPNSAQLQARQGVWVNSVWLVPTVQHQVNTQSAPADAFP